MPIWERYSVDNTLVAAGSIVNDQLFHNEEDTDNFQSADVIIVDGIVTVITTTDNLVGVRLVIAHEIMVSGDLTQFQPAPHDRMVYYSWFCARGPLVFRLRSKKTIPPENKLWLQTWKEKGALSTEVKVGVHMFLHLKH